MQDGRFREDLYYRLNIVGLTCPRWRSGARTSRGWWIASCASSTPRWASSSAPSPTRPWTCSRRHDYPGNVRELENAIEHALVLCQGSTVHKKHLPEPIQKATGHKVRGATEPLQSAEARTIQATLDRCGGNRVAAAQALGLHRSTLWRKMQRYGIG